MVKIQRNEPPFLRIGIAGLGIAGSALLPAIAKHPFVKVTAAFARNKERLAKFANDYGADVHYSMEDLCSNSNVDAVYIATPTELHKDHVLIAAEHKKHIIVEKPIATTLEDADTLIKAAYKNGIQLIVGHSQSFEPPIQAIREIIQSGKIGQLKMVNNWYFNDWIYRPRTAEELDTDLGGGVTYRQGSHQFDIIRYIGGGLLRSVRSMAGRWDKNRPTEGAHAAYLEFEDGTAATAVYNGYDHFHSTDLTFGIGEGGPLVTAEEYASSRRMVKQISNLEKEADLKSQAGYGGARAKKYDSEQIHHPFFGLTIVSCERGDIRQSPNGLFVYGEEEKYEISLQKETGRDVMIAELYDAVYGIRKSVHDGRWGKANLEVCIAVLESSQQRKEVYLSHQVPVNDSKKMSVVN